MLTRLHAAGWCLVDFFKPADYLVIQGTRKSGGGGGRLLKGGGAFIRDNTVHTQTERLNHLEPSKQQMCYFIIGLCDLISSKLTLQREIYVYIYMFVFVIFNYFFKITMIAGCTTLVHNLLFL